MNRKRTGTIPIYINNFNWLTSTRSLAQFFDEVPGTEVVIVDNNSTYEPLLEWYASECPYRVIRLRDNLGSKAAWRCGAVLPPEAHRFYYGSPYYVVTDPDLSLAGCPKDVLERLISGLEAYPEITKAGVSLEIDDVPQDSEIGRAAIEWEKRFWAHRRDARFFGAAVDTTFALYRVGVAPDGKTLRSDRPYTARHLPWYFTAETLTDEQRYYIAHAKPQAWTAQLRKALHLDAAAAQQKASGAMSRAMSRAASGDRWRATDAERSRYDPQWAVSRELETAILVLLDAYRPRSILETGPGLSSIMLYKYGRELGGVEYYHIDHRGPANARFQEHLEELGFSRENAFVCELTEEYYDLSQARLPRGRQFDFILLDGPPASQQRASATQREFIEKFGGPDTIYIQDDTHRKPEASVIERLIDRFGADHFVRYEIQDQTHPWRTSSLLLPRRRRPEPSSLAAKLISGSEVAWHADLRESVRKSGGKSAAPS